MKILFATHNRNKLEEVRKRISPQFELLCLADIENSISPEETGTTLKENAAIKANSAFKALGIPSFSDDSGLFVQALQGAPGVYSADYAGEHGNAEKNIDKLLSELSHHPERSAYFETCIAFREENGIHFFTGRVHGQITHEPAGAEGFGYDPVFLPDGSEQTFGQMDSVSKYDVSHRSRALEAFTKFLLSRGSSEQPEK